MKNFKDAMNELNEIGNLESAWLRKHWKGYALVITIVLAAFALYEWIDYRRFTKNVQQITNQGIKACEDAREDIRKWQVVTDENKKDAWRDEIAK